MFTDSCKDVDVVSSDKKATDVYHSSHSFIRIDQFCTTAIVVQRRREVRGQAKRSESDVYREVLLAQMNRSGMGIIHIIG